MRNFVGVLLLIIGLGLILTDGGRSGFDEDFSVERNDAQPAEDPEIGDPATNNNGMQLQPVLGVVFILAGAGVLIYAFNNKGVR